MRTVLLFALLLPAAPARAEALPSESSHEARGAYVTVNVGSEMHALELAAADTARATEELARAVHDLAASPSLSEQHRLQLIAVLGRVDSLSSRVDGAVERLPAAVQESREPLVAMAADLAAQVRWLIAGVVLLLLTTVLGALAGLYVLVLRPGRRLVATAAGGAQKLLHALERAAEVLAGANTVLRTKPSATPSADREASPGITPENRTDPR